MIKFREWWLYSPGALGWFYLLLWEKPSFRSYRMSAVSPYFSGLAVDAP
ncbi:hypothetical protein SAMN04487859_101249 [Roseovarius lutimaris]|uniref:Uncharacterized protein n=1 Tax=Roseovarius lutimaris TaxID=1005928 RepID=A0A1I4YJ81_9RHOB|nr:hypothetical protein SAMN04487859_101249 [Roseovarius lutimaris]